MWAPRWKAACGSAPRLPTLPEPQRTQGKFGWFREMSRRRSPESLWLVIVDDERIAVTDRAGQSPSIAKQDLAAIAIETTDSGPWESDVWWLFFGPYQQLAC